MMCSRAISEFVIRPGIEAGRDLYLCAPTRFHTQQNRSFFLDQNPSVLAVASALRCSCHFLPQRSGTVSSTSMIDS